MNSFFDFLFNIYKPEVFHGYHRKDNFFEGWYFKLVDKSGRNVLAIIPGIFINKDTALRHSFIQVLDGKTHTSHYCRYNFEDFKVEREKFDLDIAGSHFTPDYIELNIVKEDILINGKVDFTGLKPWPVTLKSPGIMGWYSYVPFMECNHGVLSLDHEIKGSLNYNGKNIDFSGGRGYIEKDWGSNFPSSYVWLQCNHFDREGISFAGSVARIPWHGSWFRGYIFGLLLDGKLYRMTTYTGAKLDYLRMKGNKISLSVSDKRYRMEAEALQTKTGTLYGPFESRMLQRVSESLDSEINISFYSINNGKEKLIYRGHGIHAGVEANGKLEEIVDKS